MGATARHVMLESGDRLSRQEFHRLYCELPEIKKAELVEGVVYVGSPVRSSVHGEPHANVIGWLTAYRIRVPGLRLTDNGTVILDESNELQPDACLWREEPAGPRSSEEDYIEGAPQLVFEVAASSASYDLHDKLRVYERNGVKEYVVWRVLEDAIDWFELRGGRFVQVEPNDDGAIESSVFPGLRLNVPKMLSGDIVGVLADLDR